MRSLLPYFRYLKQHKLAYFGGLLLGVIFAATSGFGMAFITAKILPVLFSKDADYGTDQKLLMISLIPAVAILKGVSGYFSSYLVSYCERKITLKLQAELMEFLQTLSLSFYHKNRTGNLMARVLNDNARIAAVVTRCAADMVRQPVAIFGAFCVIVYLSFQNHDIGFLAVALLLLPVCIALARSVGTRITAREKQIGMSEGSLHSIIHESIASARETRAFNLHERELSQFNRKARWQMKVMLRLIAYRNAISPMVEIVSAFGVAAALLIATKSGISIEAIVPLLLALYLCYKPWKTLGKIYAEVQRASMAVERINRIYATREVLPEPAHPRTCGPFREALSMDGVSFAYRKQKLVLKQLDLTIRKGEVVALVGPSGAGKSTISHLLCRFYDPQRGTVRYDGVDVREFRQADLRHRMAFVPQDSFLYADTVRENIRMGRLDASDAEVEEAARKANALAFIEDLPQGFDTVVSERGASLSGGQRQRIAIARAFLRDAEILILDEATSSLDADSEWVIQQALERLFENRTVIIIAHRYSTIRMADRILLFEDGQLLMAGDEYELEQASPFFRNVKFAGSDQFTSRLNE
ncbi:ABC transporter ATP-binding protein [Coraliomargarita parva]|uniref:ABC transporter ATP-binding protein n=1 Tax=Coraliomargarita parva TaxID=3014050 RepID=UPI0022B5A950|nr:ABC transporter ATP-binding protein [Coraliomargarita parva]